MARDCSSCHREHQGRDFAIGRVTDAACVRCHKDLNELHAQGTPASATHSVDTVNGFDRDHPEFRVVKQWTEAAANGLPSPRTLKFSHALHMNPGIVGDRAELAKEGRPLTPAALRPGDRERYRRFTADGSDKEPIRLDCSACHELDAGRSRAAGGDSLPLEIKGLPVSALAPPRQTGEYYLPVLFEKHCQACHGLDLIGVESAKGLKLDSFHVPHRYQPADLDKLIRGEVARRIFESRHPMETRTPGERLDPLAKPPAPESLRMEAEDLVRRINEFVYDLPAAARDPGELRLPSFPPGERRGGFKCLKCHDAQPGTTAFDLPVAIVRPSSPPIWLAAARFNHSAHRALTCASCHQGKEAAFMPTDRRAVREQLAIPGIENCRQCHAPAGTKDGQPTGGVRHACADCHRYHGADEALHGRGSPLREPTPDRRFDVESFLRGAQPRGGSR